MADRPTDLRRISAKYPGDCVSCNIYIEAGDRIYWSRSSKETWHVDCLPSNSSDKDSSDKPQSLNSNQNKWRQLCEYLRLCVLAKVADPPSYHSDKNKWQLYRDGPEFLITGERDEVLVSEAMARQSPLSRVVEQLSQDRASNNRRSSLIYGWPTLLARNQRGHLVVAPLLITAITLQQDGEKLTMCAESEPDYNLTINTGGLSDISLEAVHSIIGEGLPFGDLGSMLAKIREICEVIGFDILSDLDPSRLGNRLYTTPGVHNVAVVISTTNQEQYVADLVKELKALEKVEDWTDTAAALLIRPRLNLDSNPDAYPVIAPLKANFSQETALEHFRKEPLTVVKGPPGTGKTQLVANAVSNEWLDDHKVLVSSTNNQAVDVVYERTKEEHLARGLLFRTGNRYKRDQLAESVTSAVAEAQSRQGSDVNQIRAQHYRTFKKRYKLVNHISEQADIDWQLYGVLAKLEKAYKTIWNLDRSPNLEISLEKMESKIHRLERARFFSRFRLRRFLRSINCTQPGIKLKDIKAWITNERKHQTFVDKLNELNEIIGDPDSALQKIDKDWQEISQDLVVARVANCMVSSKATGLFGSGPSSRIRELIQMALEEDINGWACTALSIRPNFPLTAGLFDLVIIDEASQCDIAVALPLAYRAKRLAIIGDPLQLSPIVNLNSKHHETIVEKVGLDETDLRNRGLHFCDSSAYHSFEVVLQLRDSKPRLLNEHYRCHPEIARWFNCAFYGGELEILTDVSSFISDSEQALIWSDVEGQAVRGNNGSWINIQEAEYVVDLLRQCLEVPGRTVGVVTPFSAQARRIKDLVQRSIDNELLDQADFISGTAHRFQGDERDVIIFSPVITPGIERSTVSWIEGNRNLLNVAVSRARQSLFIVGHPGMKNLGSDTLVSLREYAKQEQYRAGEGDRTSTVDRYRTDSQAERRLLDAMWLSDLIPTAKAKVIVGGYELDFVLEDGPLRLNIEVDGDQHLDSRGYQRRQDLARDRILRKMGWDVMRIPAWRCFSDPQSALQEIEEYWGRLQSGRLRG